MAEITYDLVLQWQDRRRTQMGAGLSLEDALGMATDFAAVYAKHNGGGVMIDLIPCGPGYADVPRDGAGLRKRPPQKRSKTAARRS